MLSPEFRKRFPGISIRSGLLYLRWRVRGQSKYQRLPDASDPSFAAAYEAAKLAKLRPERQVHTTSAESAVAVRRWNARCVRQGDAHRVVPAWLLTLAREARKRAAKRDLGYSLTRDQLSLLALRAGDACEMTGLPFQHTPFDGSLYRPFAPSIDLIDPADGYHFYNVRLTTVIVNAALNQWGEGPFWTMVMAAADRSGAKRENEVGQK